MLRVASCKSYRISAGAESFVDNCIGIQADIVCNIGAKVYRSVLLNKLLSTILELLRYFYYLIPLGVPSPYDRGKEANSPPTIIARASGIRWAPTFVSQLLRAPE